MVSNDKLQAKLARRCRQLRQEHELSQMDVVRRFDFTLSHYQKIERGTLDPRFSTLKRLSDVFGLSLSEFLDGL